MQRIPHLLGKAVRESGQALDRLGLTISGVESFLGAYSRHRSIMPMDVDKNPEVSATAFVAPNASVIGNVKLGEGSSVWYNSILRADSTDSEISIGKKTNIQDRSVLTGKITIGDNVTVGHGALMSGNVTIGDEVLIGQGSIISEDSVIEGKSIVAAGAVVLPRTTVPSGQMWAGNPAKFMRACKDGESAGFVPQADHYVALASDHAKSF
jgi:gamma-carbonic anhydrase